jgi:hypothetical protein
MRWDAQEMTGHLVSFGPVRHGFGVHHRCGVREDLRGGYSNPIGDPVLSLTEALTLLEALLMVYLLSVLFGREQNSGNR